MHSGSQISVPPLSKTNKIIIITMVVLFLLSSILAKFSSFNLGAILGLSLGGMREGYIFSLVTYPLIGSSLIEVVFNGLLLWFLGGELERMWGAKRYLALLSVSAIGAGIIYLAVSFFLFRQNPMLAYYPLRGMVGACSALMLVYAIIYPNRTFMFMLIFPVKAKYFCMILIAMELYMGVFSPGGVQAWGHLGAMLCGFLYVRTVALGKQKARFKNEERERALRQKRISRSHLSIVEEEDKDKKTRYWQ